MAVRWTPVTGGLEHLIRIRFLELPTQNKTKKVDKWVLTLTGLIRPSIACLSRLAASPAPLLHPQGFYARPVPYHLCGKASLNRSESVVVVRTSSAMPRSIFRESRKKKNIIIKCCLCGITYCSTGRAVLADMVPRTVLRDYRDCCSSF